MSEDNSESKKISQMEDEIGFIMGGSSLSEAEKLARALRKQREGQIPQREPTREDYLEELKYIENERRGIKTAKKKDRQRSQN